MYFSVLWCVSGNHGLGWKSKLFSRAKNVKKSEKVHFGELQVRKAISQTLYELGTSGLAYLTHYNQYLMILHYPWLRVKSKLFSRAKNAKSKKLIFVRTPSSTSDFSDFIWARDFGVGLLDSLWSVLYDFALKSKLTDFILSHGFLKRITYRYFLSTKVRSFWHRNEQDEVPFHMCISSFLA